MAIIAPCVRHRVARAAKKNEKFVWREVERSDMKSIDGGWRSVKRFEGQQRATSKQKLNEKKL